MLSQNSTTWERICVGDEIFEDDTFQGMVQSAVAAGGPAEAPPEAELQAMLVENQEDPRANQFLTWVTCSCWSATT